MERYELQALALVGMVLLAALPAMAEGPIEAELNGVTATVVATPIENGYHVVILDEHGNVLEERDDTWRGPFSCMTWQSDPSRLEKVHVVYYRHRLARGETVPPELLQSHDVVHVQFAGAGIRDPLKNGDDPCTDPVDCVTALIDACASIYNSPLNSAHYRHAEMCEGRCASGGFIDITCVSATGPGHDLDTKKEGDPHGGQ